MHWKTVVTSQQPRTRALGVTMHKMKHSRFTWGRIPTARNCSNARSSIFVIYVLPAGTAPSRHCATWAALKAPYSAAISQLLRLSSVVWIPSSPLSSGCTLVLGNGLAAGNRIREMKNDAVLQLHTAGEHSVSDAEWRHRIGMFSVGERSQGLRLLWWKFGRKSAVSLLYIWLRFIIPKVCKVSWFDINLTWWRSSGKRFNSL